MQGRRALSEPSISPDLSGVLIDLSGVLTQEAPGRIEDFAAECHLQVDAWTDIYRRCCDRERRWDQVERGELELLEFARDLAVRIESKGGFCTAERAMTLFGDPDPFTCATRVRTELFPLIAELRKHFTTGLCTNNVKEWRPAWTKLVPVSELFDHVFDSSALGCRKPELMFWMHVETSLGMEGQELLLIDDSLENVLTARAARGWQTFFYTDLTPCAGLLKGLASR